MSAEIGDWCPLCERFFDGHRCSCLKLSKDCAEEILQKAIIVAKKTIEQNKKDEKTHTK